MVCTNISLNPVIDWMFLFPQNLYAENLMIKVIVLGSDLWEADYVMKVDPSWVGWCPYKRDFRQLLCPFCQWGHNKEMAVCEPGSSLSPNSKSAEPWSWAFLTPEYWEIHVCLLATQSTVWFCFLFFYSRLRQTTNNININVLCQLGIANKT